MGEVVPAIYIHPKTRKTIRLVAMVNKRLLDGSYREYPAIIRTDLYTYHEDSKRWPRFETLEEAQLALDTWADNEGWPVYKIAQEWEYVEFDKLSGKRKC